MKLQVKEILAIPALREISIIAGESGLSKPISSIIYGEIPNYKNIRGEELVFTTGYLFKDNPAKIKDILDHLVGHGVSAMAIELGRFIDKLPPEAIRIADEHAFPILNVPESLGLDMINAVQGDIIDRQTRRLEFSEKTLKLFTSELALGGNSQHVMDHLSDILQKKVVYYDRYYHQHLFSGIDGKRDGQISEPVLREIIKSKKKFPINMQSRKYGYILLPDFSKNTKLSEYEMIAIDHASTVIKLQIQKKVSNAQIENNYKNALIQELITDNMASAEALKRRAFSYGWDLTRGGRVVIVQVDATEEWTAYQQKIRENEEILQEAKRYCIGHLKGSIAGSFADSLILLLAPLSEDDSKTNEKIKAFGDQLRREIGQNYRQTISIGIGMYKEKIKELHQSYGQAKKAIELGRTVYGNDHTNVYSELGLFNVLEPVCRRQEAKFFCHEQLGALQDYDCKHGTDLMGSLEALWQNDWNLRAASGSLFIHYNTMKYRLNKICEILSVDTFTSEKKLNIGVALKLIKFIDEGS